MYTSTKIILLSAVSFFVLAQACTSSKAVNSENLEVVEVVEAQVSISFSSVSDETKLVEAMPNYGLRRKARSSRSQPIYVYFYNTNAVDGQALVAELKALEYVTSASLLQ